MRATSITDRYAGLPTRAWLWKTWHSTRKAACGCWLTGTIEALQVGQVRVTWSECAEHPGQPPADSWEPVERGTLARQPTTEEPSTTADTSRAARSQT